jgi:hypothetical protein
MMKVGLMSAASSIKADLLTEKFISPYGCRFWEHGFKEKFHEDREFLGIMKKM